LETIAPPLFSHRRGWGQVAHEGMVLRAHLKDHVTTAHERGDVEEIVEELMEALKYR